VRTKRWNDIVLAMSQPCRCGGIGRCARLSRIVCSRRQAVKASALHTDTRSFDPSREYQTRAFSSVAERGLDMADVGGSIPDGTTNMQHSPDPCIAAREICNWRAEYADPVETGATRRRNHQSPRIRSVKPDWRWSGLLTRAQVVRNHPDPPVPSRTSAPSGYGSGFLIRRRKSPSVRVRPGPPIRKSSCDLAGYRKFNFPRSWRNW
jgi:hypothetical protein